MADSTPGSLRVPLGWRGPIPTRAMLDRLDRETLHQTAAWWRDRAANLPALPVDEGHICAWAVDEAPGWLRCRACNATTRAPRPPDERERFFVLYELK